jgi:alanyl-tRNA synthetase
MKQIDKIRHSLAHLLAIEVLKFDPNAKLAIGPVIENGFYYDFEFSSDKNPTEKDLKDFQKGIKKLISGNINFEYQEISEEKAYEFFTDQPYKLELIDDLVKNGEKLSIYKSGDFIDLCAGPHIENTKEINADAIKITKIAGAYWRGDENNKMLTRIYGVAFETKEELELHMQLTYKQSIEIAEEEAINNTLAQNKWDEIRRRLNYDLTVLGIACVKTNFNVSEGIKTEYVDPAYLVYSYTEDPNFEELEESEQDERNFATMKITQDKCLYQFYRKNW